MARHFIHYYFSQKITENASYALSAILKLYPDAYLLGSLGADLFVGTEHKSRLATTDPLQLFGVTARHIYTNGSKCRLSYMLGFLSHYALDRVLNPYLSYFAANGVAGYYGGKIETVSLDEIEIGVDRHIVRDYLGMEKALSLVGKINTRKAVLDEITDLYVTVLNDLSDLYLNEHKTYAMLEGVRPDIPLAEGLGRLDYMNRENREWKNAQDERLTLSVDEILTEEIEPAYALLEEYMAMARSDKAPDESKFRLNGLGETV
ncbi:MAG: zinc dependent phospholipase C family protein [Clostridia bacterium]|nr:zinc dependent phospholipase C family protein [Clostridia bacterium]